MRFNENDMLEIATSRKPELEGRLQHRSPHNGTFRESVFRERFFKLVGNLLFYYRISDLSQIEDEPMGVMVLENYSVFPDSTTNLPFAFELLFHDEPEKRHIFTTRTEDDMAHWVKMLQNSSYQHWRDQYDDLISKLNSIYDQKHKEASFMIKNLSKNRIQSTTFIPSRWPVTSNNSKVKPTVSEEDLIKF